MKGLLKTVHRGPKSAHNLCVCLMHCHTAGTHVQIHFYPPHVWAGNGASRAVVRRVVPVGVPYWEGICQIPTVCFPAGSRYLPDTDGKAFRTKACVLKF